MLIGANFGVRFIRGPLPRAFDNLFKLILAANCRIEIINFMRIYDSCLLIYLFICNILTVLCINHHKESCEVVLEIILFIYKL